MSNEWPPMPLGAPAGDGDDTGSSPNTRIYTIASAMIVVVLGVVAVVFSGAVAFESGDNSGIEEVVVQGAPPAPLFEPLFGKGDDPFFPLALQLIGYEAETGTMPTLQDIETGLFGGTLRETCDPERLIDFLTANPDMGRAWAHVQGIDFSEIPSYIGSLDVRVLAAPAVVLNHGFDAARGAAYEVEAEFEAGTAVLVDANGDIRARCYCGNPVKPKPVAHRPPRCLASPLLVYTEPRVADPVTGAVSDVVLTGRTTESAEWVEVSWGATETETGWTQAGNIERTLCADSASVVPAVTASPEPSATATVVPTAAPQPEPAATPRPTATPRPAPAPTATPRPQPTATPAPRATTPPVATPTPTAAPVTGPLQITCGITKTNVVVGESTRFSATHTPAEVDLTYRFNFGAGSQVGNPVTVTYTSPGQYQVTLDATNSAGEVVRSGQICNTVTVIEEDDGGGGGGGGPDTVQLRCSISNTQLQTNQVTTITGTSDPGGLPVSWVIDHGDGFRDTRNPSQATYVSPGSYNVYADGTYQGSTVNVFCGTITVTQGRG